MINSINFIDGLDGLLAGVVAHRGPDPGHHLARHRGRRSQPLVALLCALLAGSLAGLPALELPPGAGLHRHGRRASPWATRWPCCRSWARPRSPSRCSSWACPSSTPSGSSSGASRQRPLALHADRGHLHHRLLDLGLTHRGRCCSSTPSRVVWPSSGSAVLSGARPAVCVPGHRHRRVALVLFLLTRRAGRAARREQLSRRARAARHPRPSGGRRRRSSAIDEADLDGRGDAARARRASRRSRVGSPARPGLLYSARPDRQPMDGHAASAWLLRPLHGDRARPLRDDPGRCAGGPLAGPAAADESHRSS